MTPLGNAIKDLLQELTPPRRLTGLCPGNLHDIARWLMMARAGAKARLPLPQRRCGFVGSAATPQISTQMAFTALLVGAEEMRSDLGVASSVLQLMWLI